MPQLHETRMGMKLMESTLPRIAGSLERIVTALEKEKTEEQTWKEKAFSDDITKALEILEGSCDEQDDEYAADMNFVMSVIIKLQGEMK